MRDVPSPVVRDRLLSVHDVADYLNLKPRWAYDAAAAGYMPCRRLGRMLRFTASQVDAWLLSDRLSGNPLVADLDGSSLMDVEDLRAHWNCSRAWIYEQRRSHGLPHFKLGRHLRFSRPMVDAWLAATYPNATTR